MAKFTKVVIPEATFTVELSGVELLAVLKTVGKTSYQSRIRDYDCTEAESTSIDNLYDDFYSQAVKLGFKT